MENKTQKIGSSERFSNPERVANTAASASMSNAASVQSSVVSDEKKKLSPATIAIACIAAVALVFCAWSMSQYVNGKDPLAFVTGVSSEENAASTSLGESSGSSAVSAEKSQSSSSASAGENGATSSGVSSEQSESDSQVSQEDSSVQSDSSQDEAPQSSDSGTSNAASYSAEAPSAAIEPATTTDQPDQSNSISVNITIDGTAAGSNAASGTISLSRGATAYDALLASGASVNARNSAFGMYVAAINGLAEKEHGANSGWLYSVNGVELQTSCSNAELDDGDTVVWHYTVG